MIKSLRKDTVSLNFFNIYPWPDWLYIAPLTPIKIQLCQQLKSAFRTLLFVRTVFKGGHCKPNFKRGKSKGGVDHNTLKGGLLKGGLRPPYELWAFSNIPTSKILTKYWPILSNFPKKSVILTKILLTDLIVNTGSIFKNRIEIGCVHDLFLATKAFQLRWTVRHKNLLVYTCFYYKHI